MNWINLLLFIISFVWISYMIGIVTNAILAIVRIAEALERIDRKLNKFDRD